MRASDILMMSGNDDIGQHVSLTDKTVLQISKVDIFLLFLIMRRV